MNKLFFILFLLLGSFGYSQTYIDVTDQYIQNPSFEEYTACPQSNSFFPSQMWIDSVVGWYAPTNATSDYFNACNVTANGIPSNNVTYQSTFDGVGYCGFLAYTLWSNRMWSEYIQTMLLQPLEANVNYRFTMRINRANGYNFAVENIGANFSNGNLYSAGVSPYDLAPTVLNPTGFLTDTIGWVLVSGEFTANGNENYLTIGWFGDTITNDFTFFIPPDIDPMTGDSLYLTDTYYLVDSVKLYQIENDLNDFNINVITPNGDNVNDVMDLSVYKFGELNFVILNSWGNVVWQSYDPNSKWDGKTLFGELVSEGTYFYRLDGVDYFGNKINKSGFVQVVR